MTTTEFAPIDQRHGVIIPSFNSGPQLEKTVREVLAHWRPVIVVIDGSTDGSDKAIRSLAASTPGLHMLFSADNQGKGCAIMSGMRLAADQGLTHIATFDADGQHHAPDLVRFIETSRKNPSAMILGAPVFGPDAPRIRVMGHRIANFFSTLETYGAGLGDSLFGFRVYPVFPSLSIFRKIRNIHGFDVETQLVVRLSWKGIPAINLSTPVTYRSKAEGGISHFRYVRDNLLLIRTHALLVVQGFSQRILSLLRRLMALINPPPP